MKGPVKTKAYCWRLWRVDEDIIVYVAFYGDLVSLNLRELGAGNAVEFDVSDGRFALSQVCLKWDLVDHAWANKSGFEIIYESCNSNLLKAILTYKDQYGN